MISLPSNEEIIKLLDLKPLLPEGGFYGENYRSNEMIKADCLPRRYAQNRSFGTSIYYLLTDETFSLFHRLKSDEIYHFYLGDPAEIFLLCSGGKEEKLTLGQDIMQGELLQIAVQRGTWQGLRMKPRGKYALMGTTVSPGFEFEDFELGNRNELIKEFPGFKEEIEQLTIRVSTLERL